MMERQFGKVATPLKVFYARKPGFLPLLMLINRTADRGISLEPELRLLVFDFVDTLNGCSFCDDYRLAIAVQKRIGTEKFAALADFRTSDLFSGRERAALAYAEEATKHSDVSDETYQEVQHHFTEVEIVELTWLVAIENYFNLIKVPLQISSDGLRELAEERIETKIAAGVG
jgi:alkylhydroperoxidase family enzyme